ncbi:hypothetical protein GCM10010420_41400 [Streptomyces glaucosporus]|uniref:Uncharacterized protein n=1 Tax=Streptomyces glaucosporus TaxID=284044 RepID=A0ABN3IPA7_9ACTN
MTTDTAPAPAAVPPATAPRRALRAVAIAACLPYLAIKTAWLTGSHIGIPEGSELLAPENATAMLLVNSLTLAMDAAVVVLALALTLP